ncbi:response regulator transcription factor [Sphingomonas sp. OTU376]|uniref:response regulator transcription factor n=1 Tax=Sphingomonas sp. OTU376 TaxID=3043863 RepID=UPI00313F15E1
MALEDTGPQNALVCIVDDDASVRDGLSRLLESAGYRAVAYHNAQSFLAAPSPEGPACLLFDVRLPDLDGLQLQEHVAGLSRRPPIIFMTGHGTIPMSVRAIKSGAVEFLTKPIDSDVLLATIEDALSMDRDQLVGQREEGSLQQRLDSLTPRENEVLRRVIAGPMIKQLAAALGTSEVTAKVHKRRVMEKMGARTLVELIHMAERLGIEALPIK